MSRLGTRLIALHRSLNGVPHAFGGAIALAYCVREPRATRDLDVNVFVPTASAGRMLRALPAAVRVEDADVATALRDGQVRVWWDETPLDLFFNEHEFHVWVSTTVREVPFESETIPDRVHRAGGVQGPVRPDQRLGRHRSHDRGWLRAGAGADLARHAATRRPPGARPARRPVIGRSRGRLGHREGGPQECDHRDPGARRAGRTRRTPAP